MKIVLTQQNLLPILFFSQTRKSQVCHPFRFQHSVPICHPRHLLLLIPQEIKKEEIAGFKAKVCETCMRIVIETQYSIDVSGKSPEVVNKNSHICIASKVPSKTLTLESKTRQAFETLGKLEDGQTRMAKTMPI
jgi:hypothetical protein